MRWLAVMAGAFALVSSAAAGTATTKVPAPAPGKVRVELLTIKASKTPTLKVTNLSALGAGFGGVVVLGPSKKSSTTYLAYFVMYMGNASTSPASTVNVQISGGTPSGQPKDDSNSCEILTSLFNGDYRGFTGLGAAIAHKIDEGESAMQSELKNDLGFQRQNAGCK